MHQYPTETTMDEQEAQECSSAVWPGPRLECPATSSFGSPCSPQSKSLASKVQRALADISLKDGKTALLDMFRTTLHNSAVVDVLFSEASQHL